MSQDGERETNGGKRKGERKEDSGGDGERSVGTFWYRWRIPENTVPKLQKSHRQIGTRDRSKCRERSEKSAMKRREAVTFDRSTGCRDDDDDERKRQIRSER